MSATFALSAAAPVGRAAAASTSLRQRRLKSSPRQPGGARRTPRGGTVYARVSGTERTSTTSQISSQIKDIRSQMEEDEDLNTLMAGLRGTNIDDSDFAADGVAFPALTSLSLTCVGLKSITFTEANTPALVELRTPSAAW